uniref:Uncharacterized protein n=1 Tax=Anguilla anguilla TaxID=7936 RepID=A0A0E9WUD7_ANGAN
MGLFSVLRIGHFPMATSRSLPDHVPLPPSAVRSQRVQTYTLKKQESYHWPQSTCNVHLLLLKKREIEYILSLSFFLCAHLSHQFSHSDVVLFFKGSIFSSFH